ncbi:4a-hydroxytetrahydrobiopterin dehydratase [Actinocatenispora sera]|uniref:Putative pterin-4-alpha-carbinolamine dehydratase n=1 Tax=Actinocatenispora sera TaxID=390989 RepID=A0A810KST1_9ACTN|nr:4a-hydroxytetrahydrobiopterin dehydratase [Actinocatenispora sera]BCJ25974.1 putative pterin-4-alpha-carbinolamine dehydratase [Actinocatenispora sera]
MGTLLSAQQVADGLRALPAWHGDTTEITRSYTAPDFLSGIRAVDAVADAAEAAGHHPDIDIRWTTITFTLVTHASGGVTEADLRLAATIDELLGTSA